MPNTALNFSLTPPLSEINLTDFRNIFRQEQWYSDFHGLPAKAREWLGYTDSLTEKLQMQCATLTVEITAQGWQQAVRSPSFFTNPEQVWVREVVLTGDGQPWIFAQTVLPEPTIHRVAQDVLTLGEQPIGLWLFPQKPIRKSLEWVQDDLTGLYARRSVLELKGYPLAIYELFLPHLIR